MPTGAVPAIPRIKFVDSAGNPVAGGSLTVYLAGTTTKANSWQDKAMTVLNENPMTLDGNGEALVWLDASAQYKLLLKDSLGSTLPGWPVDNVTPTLSSVDLSDATGAALIGTAYGTLAADLAAARPVARGGTGATTAAGARASLGFTSPVIDRAYAEYTANADLTVLIPGDDTIPQNTEGTQILSVTLTPKSTTSRIRLRFQGEFALLNAGSAAFAIFSSATSDAIRAQLVTGTGATLPTMAQMEHEYVPGVTSSITYTVRVGPIAANTMRMNGNTSSRFFGGTAAATLVVEEIAV